MQTRMCLLIGLGLLLLPGRVALAQQDSVAELTKLTASGPVAERVRAINALALLGPRGASAVPALAELLKDKDASIRSHAAFALGRIGAASKPVATDLLELFVDSDPAVRRAAVQAVSRIKPDRSVTLPKLLQVLEQADPGSAVTAINALSEMGAAVVPGAIEALKREKARYWACLLLEDIGAPAKDAAPALLAVLDDKRPEVRMEALLAMAAIGADSAEAIQAIGQRLDDEQNSVRYAATFALAQLGPKAKEQSPKIIDNVRSDDEFLRTISVAALAKLNPDNQPMVDRSVRVLVKSLASSDQRSAGGGGAQLDGPQGRSESRRTRAGRSPARRRLQNARLHCGRFGFAGPRGDSPRHREAG